MKAFDSAWNYIWDKLFCSRTNLFYDYLADGVDATSCLPTSKEIGAQFPNPCGWGTGMEDSMMSAGTMLDTVLSRYEREKTQALADMAHRIFQGMKLCATVSNSPGFLARSVSPVDGHSHFCNSSRDQYTHFVYSAWRLFHSAIVTTEEKRDIQRILSAIADRAIGNFNPEHGYELSREDGFFGFVGKMWDGVLSHEVMRYPMFCMAAWNVTGEEWYYQAAQGVMQEALALSEAWTAGERDWAAFAILQMQYSLRLVWETEIDDEVKQRLGNLMRRLAEFSQKYVLETREKLRQGQLKTDAVNPNWRNRSFILYDATLNDGYAYFVPCHEKVYLTCCFEPLRGAGQGVIIQKLCPDWKTSQEQMEALQEITASIDYEKHASYAPILLVGGWFMS